MITEQIKRRHLPKSNGIIKPSTPHPKLVLVGLHLEKQERNWQKINDIPSVFSEKSPEEKKDSEKGEVTDLCEGEKIEFTHNFVNQKCSNS